MVYRQPSSYNPPAAVYIVLSLMYMTSTSTGRPCGHIDQQFPLMLLRTILLHAPESMGEMDLDWEDEDEVFASNEGSEEVLHDLVVPVLEGSHIVRHVLSVI